MIQRIDANAARDLLYDLPAKPVTESCKLAYALGRVLAQDINATIPIPPFDRSPWDGYVLRSADTENASHENPVTLKITEELPAGVAPTIALNPGFAAKILTGAPIPTGGDCTVKFEQTDFTESEVRIFERIPPGKDMVCAGDDVKLGALIARCGDVITPPLMGLIASVGVDEFSVFKQPRAAILSTGSELVKPGKPLPAAKIYNSNVFTLTGYLRGQGVDAFDFGVIDDDVDAIAERIRAALDAAEIVITTGGASVGDYDCAIRTMEMLGAEILFWKTTIKPGGAVAASMLNEKLILSLPGNPGGAIMFLLRCAMPYIKKLCGQTVSFCEPVDVYLKKPFDKLSDRSRMLRGYLEIIGGKAYFTEHGPQGGGDISSYAGADLLAEIPADSAPLPSGAMVKAWRI